MKVLLWAFIGVVAMLAAFALFGPREPIDLSGAAEPVALGDDLDNWLAERESRVPELRPGVQKRIRWAGAPGERTPLSVVYIHGFSATSEEIRPVPDQIAEALGANLFFTRLTGHGRDGAALAEASAGDWVRDTAEALEIGRRIGDRVLVLSTSTGSTLAALAATDPDLSRDLAGVVMISPNFGLANPASRLLTLPAARLWVPAVAGAERGFEPLNDAHARFWTTRYPTVALLPMSALVDHVSSRDFTSVQVPALFIYSEQDEVVSPARTGGVYESWGGPKQRALRIMAAGDDPVSHVIAGDILSPGQTAETVEIITQWASDL